MLVATGGAAWLPKSGPWMNTVKNAIGVLLLGLSIGLLSRVLPGPVTLLLVGFLAAGVALFLGALEFVVKTARQRLAQLLGLALLVYALACWYGALSGQGDPLRPLPVAALAATGSSQAAKTDAWQNHPHRTGRRTGPGQSGRPAGAAGLVCRLVHQLQGDRA